MNDTVKTTRPQDIDPVTASVIQGALENIAVEMGYKLMRMSYSSIIRESEDFGAGLVDARGRGLAESTQSTPLQSGPIPGYVQGMLKTLKDRGDTIRPGDVITVRRRNNLLKMYQGVSSLAIGEPCDWLGSDSETLRITVQGNPGASDISLPVDGNTVVEFMSR